MNAPLVSTTVKPVRVVDAAAAGPEGSWPFLDIVRFGAALLVLFGHARGLLFESFGRVEAPTALTRAFYFLTGLHHEAVALFFVVSGFLVGGSIVRGMVADRFDPRRYFVNRFARIYIVLLPALALTGILSEAGQALLSETRAYGVRPLIPVGVTDGWSLVQVPCHLACLQGLFCAPWGANPPLWSLGYEWVLYAIAPLVFGLLTAPLPMAGRAIGLALIGATLATLALGRSWPIWFAMWFMGAAAARLHESRPFPLAAGIIGLMVTVAGLVLSRLAILPGTVTHIAVAAGLAIAIASPAIAGFGILRRFFSGAAGFSYSTYLIHLPVCVLALAILERFAGWPAHLVQPGAAGYAAFATLIAIALTSAFLFARVTEHHTATARRWLWSARRG